MSWSAFQGGTRLVRRVLDASGTVEQDPVELVGCCLSCTVRVDARDWPDPFLDALGPVGRPSHG